MPRFEKQDAQFVLMDWASRLKKHATTQTGCMVADCVHTHWAVCIRVRP